MAPAQEKTPFGDGCDRCETSSVAVQEGSLARLLETSASSQNLQPILRGCRGIPRNGWFNHCDNIIQAALPPSTSSRIPKGAGQAALFFFVGEPPGHGPGLGRPRVGLRRPAAGTGSCLAAYRDSATSSAPPGRGAHPGPARHRDTRRRGGVPVRRTARAQTPAGRRINCRWRPGRGPLARGARCPRNGPPRRV